MCVFVCATRRRVIACVEGDQNRGPAGIHDDVSLSTRRTHWLIVRWVTARAHIALISLSHVCASARARAGCLARACLPHRLESHSIINTLPINGNARTAVAVTFAACSPPPPGSDGTDGTVGSDGRHRVSYGRVSPRVRSSND